MITYQVLGPLWCDETVEMWLSLRQVQRDTGCSTKTLNKIVKVIKPFVNLSDGEDPPSNITADKTLFRATGAKILQLHGCVGCDKYVFRPTDKRIRCPKCRHPRFNSKRKPNEVCMLP